MSITEYISQQPADRQPLLQAIHQCILDNDPNVEAVAGTMMGKDMVLYNQRGGFKYGLASVKKYISLHVLPIYGNTTLHAKYQQLLPDAQFQKGCINFENAAQMPMSVVKQLIADCATIDMVAVREEYLASKKKG